LFTGETRAVGGDFEAAGGGAGASPACSAVGFTQARTEAARVVQGPESLLAALKFAAALQVNISCQPQGSRGWDT